jgi:hypothetical protein
MHTMLPANPHILYIEHFEWYTQRRVCVYIYIILVHAHYVNQYIHVYHIHVFVYVDLPLNK